MTVEPSAQHKPRIPDLLLKVTEQQLAKKYAKYGYIERTNKTLLAVDRHQALERINRGHDAAHVLTNNRGQYFFAADPYALLLDELAPRVGGCSRSFTIGEQWHISKSGNYDVEHGMYATSVIQGLDDLRAEYELLHLARAAVRKITDKNARISLQVSSPVLTKYFLQTVLGLRVDQMTSVLQLAPQMHAGYSDKLAIALGDIIGTSPQHINIASLIHDYFSARQISELNEGLRRHPDALRIVQLIELAESLGFQTATFRPDLTAGLQAYGPIFFKISPTGENTVSLGWGGRLNTELYGQEHAIGCVGLQLDVSQFAARANKATVKKSYEREIDVVALVDNNIYELAQPYIEQLRSLGLSVLTSMDGTAPTAAYTITFDKESITQKRFTLTHPGSGKTETHSVERIVSVVKDYRQ